jgi:hypothetical protein
MRQFRNVRRHPLRPPALWRPSVPIVKWNLSQPLLFAVIFHVRLGSFVGVMPRMKCVSPCGVCMMGRFFVVSSLMMLSRFGVVTRSMRMVFCRLLMVLGCFL